MNAAFDSAGLGVRRVVCFTAVTSTTLSFPGMVWRMCINLQNLNTYTTTHSHDTQDHRRGGDRSQETHTHAAELQETRITNRKDYRSGERARITMRPQAKCARSQGTTSPQISVTFRRFSYQPIIWHRGPRPKAHWYMCADAANSQNYHNHSPLSMSDVLITQTFSSWGLSSRRYSCSCPG